MSLNPNTELRQHWLSVIQCLRIRTRRHLVVLVVVQKRGTFTHATGSTSAFVAPISDCGQFVVLRIATTEKKFGVVPTTR